MNGRVARLRGILQERALDAALIGHPANRYYLSGYTGEDMPPDESAGALLVGHDAAVLLTGATNLDWAASEATAFEAKAWSRPWVGSVAQEIRDRGWRRVGFEEEAISYADHAELVAALGGDTALLPLDGRVTTLRAVKEPGELAALTAAIRLTDDVLAVALGALRPGTTEREFACRIEREMRERGADGPAFPTIVAAGPHAARPHHAPTARAIAAGEPVIVDLGVRLNGYNGDLTRTVWVGEPSARLVEVYSLVDAAQRAALGAIRAGVSGKAADAAARLVVEAAGFGEAFPHGLGHGLGIRVHEAPSAGRTSEDILWVGEVLTVEPGIYLPGWGGVRIEDVGVVEEAGFRVLTSAPKVAPGRAALVGVTGR